MIGALLSASAISILLEMKTSNVLSAIFTIIFYCFYQSQKPAWNQHKKLNQTAVMIASIWSFFMMLKGLETFEHYPSAGAIGKLTILLCIFIGCDILFFYSLTYLYKHILHHTLSIEGNRPGGRHYRVFFMIGGIILLCWLPYYCMNYPGVIISDSCDQIGQALSGIYSNHHPVMQTWLIQGVLSIGMHIFNDLSTAVALYCILQMIVLAAIYAYTVSLLYRYGIPRWLCIVNTAFYALMPYNVMFSFNMWKDSLFSAFVLLFTVLLWKIMIDKRANTHQPNTHRPVIVDTILFFIAGLGICLFRNNGFYAFCLVMPFICVICWKTKKEIVAASAATLLLVLFIKGPVFDHFQVASPDMVESLSIPLQQIARVVSDDLEITEEQTALLNQVVEVDAIATTYDARISDPIKNLVRSSGNQTFLEENKGAYLKLWLQLGIRYPFQYLRAYMHQTEGYWYPDVQYWVYADGVCQNQAGLTAAPLLPAEIGDRLQWFAWDSYTEIPLYGLLWSIGTAVWITMMLAGLCYIRGQKMELCIFLPIFALWGTLMVASPVAAEFRYLYAIFLCIPVYISASIYPYQKESSK